MGSGSMYIRYVSTRLLVVIDIHRYVHTEEVVVTYIHIRYSNPCKCPKMAN